MFMMKFSSFILLVIICFSVVYMGNFNANSNESQSCNDYQEENTLQEIKEQIIICIDPGHQKKANYDKEPIGPGAKTLKPKVSSGTQGIVTGMQEYKVNLIASNILKEILMDRGYTVIMTRDTHDVDISNKERAEYANEHQANLFIRIHCDGSNNSDIYGTSILVPSKECIYTTDIFNDSFTVANCIIDEYKCIDYLKVNGIIYRDDISGFNWSNVPAILLELGFMTCPEEDKKLSDLNYLSVLLHCVADGIDNYFN